MRKVLLIFFSFCLSCRTTQSPSSVKIVNGTDATDDDWTTKSTVFITSFGAKGEMPGFCSGSLIGDKLIITAAHCLSQFKDNRIFVHFGKDQADTKSWVEVINYQAHPNYSVEDGSTRNFDIAWMRLKNRAPEGFHRVPLYRSLEIMQAGKEVVIAGFGHDSTACLTTKCPTILRYAPMKVDHLLQSPRLPNVVVLRSEEHKNACNGDSGGPIYVEKNGIRYLAGVAMGFFSVYTGEELYSKTVCESSKINYGFPGAYLDWIESSSGEKFVFDDQENPRPAPLPPSPPPKDLSQNLQSLLEYSNYEDPLWKSCDSLLRQLKKQLGLRGSKAHNLYFDMAYAAEQLQTLKTVVLMKDVDLRPVGKLGSLESLSVYSSPATGYDAIATNVGLKSLVALGSAASIGQSSREAPVFNTSVLNDLPFLENLTLMNLRINFEKTQWENLLRLKNLNLSRAVGGINISTVPWRHFSNLYSLDISGNSLADISPIGFIPNLKILNASDNSIKTFEDIAKLKSLKVLSVNNNSITSLKGLENMEFLEFINASANPINEKACPKSVKRCDF
ncbi:MAG: trypsin-like serine protease [Proteobacteria bacterium]|nr:MAG: trypsin-like serine protease [Pseudomonadota bacterium]